MAKTNSTAAPKGLLERIKRAFKGQPGTITVTRKAHKRGGKRIPAKTYVRKARNTRRGK